MPKLFLLVMRLTGERTLPGIWHENYWFRRHEVVYRWVAERLTGDRPPTPDRRILDAGCGEGYGAESLRARAFAVTALDYDADTVEHVRRTYAGPDLHVVRGNLVALPFAAGAFDAVVSLQTVEHLWDQRAFVAECARVLADAGILMVSTPNRPTFPAGDFYHAHELAAGELRGLLASGSGSGFAAVELLGLHHGDRLRDWEAAHGTSLVDAQLAAPPDAWPPALGDLVAGLTADDFVIDSDRQLDDDLGTALDLLAVARVRSLRGE